MEIGIVRRGMLGWTIARGCCGGVLGGVVDGMLLSSLL